MHEILEYIYDLLPGDKQQRNTGWIYFNCPCCYHTENSDKKKTWEYFVYRRWFCISMF